MRKFLIAPALLLLLAATASAQSQPTISTAAVQHEEVVTPKVEAYVGYSYLRIYGEDSNGANFAVTGNVNNWFGITGDVSFHRAHDIDETYGFAMAGPRFTYRRGPITPYGHMLFGAAFGPGDTEGAVAIGGGVDAKISERVAIRLFQGEYVATSFRSNNGRISAGIVIRFGER